MNHPIVYNKLNYQMVGRVEIKAKMPKTRVHNGSANFQDGLK